MKTEEAAPSALEMEEETVDGRTEAAPKTEKGKKTLSPQSRSRNQPCRHLDFRPEKQILDLQTQNYKR